MVAMTMMQVLSKYTEVLVKYIIEKEKKKKKNQKIDVILFWPVTIIV